MDGFTKLDWFLASIVALSMAFSLFKGLTRELISLGALIWGFLFAAWLYQDLAPRLLPYARHPNLAAFTAFLAILFLFVIAGGIVSRMARGMVDKVGMRWLDRILGACFGFLRGALLAVILILALTTFSIGKEPLERSRLAPLLVEGARLITTTSPADMRERFRVGYTRLRHAWSGQPERSAPGRSQQPERHAPPPRSN